MIYKIGITTHSFEKNLNNHVTYPMGQNIVLYKYPLADISPRTEVPFFLSEKNL